VWYWFFKFFVIGPAAMLLLRCRWAGRANLPRRGPCVIAANHRTMLDPALISLGVPRRVIFVAKLKYYRGQDRKGRLMAWFLQAIGQTPIDPASGDAAAPALDTARALLSRGGVWAVFPEGTRSSQDQVHRGHTGVMRVALPLGVPVIPAGVIGTSHVHSPWYDGRFRRSAVTVRYGEPLDLTPWRDRPDDPQAWREATDALMAAIARLSEQEYVDVYAVSQSG
jgi:1-acyl-sn-glycerol-3-phosphate acyltransferase